MGFRIESDGPSVGAVLAAARAGDPEALEQVEQIARQMDAVMTPYMEKLAQSLRSPYLGANRPKTIEAFVGVVEAAAVSRPATLVDIQRLETQIRDLREKLAHIDLKTDMIVQPFYPDPPQD